MKKYKIGDTVLIRAKVEEAETYDGETTYFLSADPWDGFGEVEEKDIVPVEKPKRQQDISLPPYGKALAKELARVAR